MNGEAMLIQREPIGWKMKKAFRKLLSQVDQWVSVAVMPIIAVPAGVLVLAITGIMATGRPYSRKARKKGVTVLCGRY